MLDELDGRLLLLLTDEPRLGILECSRRLGVARGTVQARLDRLIRHGVLKGFPPALDLAEMGYGLTAFAVLEIAQGGRQQVIEQLAAIDEVCEVHATTGQGDLLVRLVARSNDDLQRVIDEVVDVTGVQRMSTSIALSTPVPPRVRPPPGASLRVAHVGVPRCVRHVVGRPRDGAQGALSPCRAAP